MTATNKIKHVFTVEVELYHRVPLEALRDYIKDAVERWHGQYNPTEDVRFGSVKRATVQHVCTECDNLRRREMIDKIDVLDHGYVRLVDHMGDDLSIVRAARVSHNAAWRTGEDADKDVKLLTYLMKNNHSTPFEHVTLTFEVKAPIFVFRQWHRHRTWSFNEMSARYSELSEEFYLPDRDKLTTQSKDNKQGRTNTALPDVEVLTAIMRQSNEDAFAVYRMLLKHGVARELARTVLPVATYSSMFATVNLWNLLRFLKLRMHEHAQYEIRVYADAMFELVRQRVPHACAIWFEQTYGVEDCNGD